jgi:hypothetical protein
VVKLILRLEPPHVFTVFYKFIKFTLSNKSFLVFLCHVFELVEGVLIIPQTSHKLALLGPLGMKDDLHSYLLPLVLQLFRIFNIGLN